MPIISWLMILPKCIYLKKGQLQSFLSCYYSFNLIPLHITSWLVILPTFVWLKEKAAIIVSFLAIILSTLYLLNSPIKLPLCCILLTTGFFIITKFIYKILQDCFCFFLSFYSKIQS